MEAINPLNAALASPKELLSLPFLSKQNYQHGATQQNHFPVQFSSPSAREKGAAAICWAITALNKAAYRSSTMSRQEKKNNPQRLCALELTP